MKVFGYTNKGLFRDINEDCILLGDNVLQHGVYDSDDFLGRIFCVADGVGGSPAGEIASKTVLETFETYKNVDLFDRELISVALTKSVIALENIEAKDTRCVGMQTTLTGICFSENNQIFNIGNGRVYRYRGGYLRQLTVDDSLINRLLINPISEDGQRIKNVITKAVSSKTLATDLTYCDFDVSSQKGDVFVLTTDGIHDYVNIDEMESILSLDTSLAEKGSLIVSKAEEIENHDNMSIILIEI